MLFFFQIFTGRTAAETNEKCSLFDPYIGADAGYVQAGLMNSDFEGRYIAEYLCR